MGSQSTRPETPSRRVRAEASAWLARLHGPERTDELDDGLRRWLAASPDHALAFEKVTAVWEEAGGISAAALLRRDSKRPQTRIEWLPRQWTATVAACLVVILAGVALFAWTHDNAITTDIGEQRTVTLNDGSRLTLNTDTRVIIEPWAATREVRLDRGEAYFEVARNPDQPFVVVAGNKKVVALGTSFVVRRDSIRNEERLSVTLIEGRVAVTDLDVQPQSLLDASAQVPVLTAGKRMVVAKTSVNIDLPKVEAVTAWRHGEVILDNTPLKDAVAELNRYSSVVLMIDNETVAGLPVSGIFRTGDSEAFAKAAATLYGLAMVKRSEKIILAGKPHPH